MMTDKEYVEKGDSSCPVCGSVEVEGGSVDIDGVIACQYVHCKDCESEWQDMYRLTGFKLVVNRPKTQLQIETLKAANS
ncbi:hypothetical protein KAR91_37545 [Candidatus Pacearchaeota archaeon]|nr:hypothetical protein [Candidatus Pacearchaeota archaeon]